MEVSLVPPDGIDYVYDEAIATMEAVSVYTGGRYEPEDLLEMCKTGGNCLLWVALDKNHKIIGTVVTTVAHYPRAKMLFFQWVGGSQLSKWKHTMYNKLERFAYSQGLDGMEGIGRLGWARLFKWNVSAFFMERKFDGIG
jgi:hypothetical protein